MAIEFNGKYYDFEGDRNNPTNFKEIARPTSGSIMSIPSTFRSLEPGNYGTVTAGLKQIAGATGMSEDFLNKFFTGIGVAKPPAITPEIGTGAITNINPNTPSTPTFTTAVVPSAVSGLTDGNTGGNPPAGATLITGQSGLAGLTESQIWRDPNSNKIYKLQQATLTSPTGTKKVVTVGSPEASNLLSSGWTLGTNQNNNQVTYNNLTQTANGISLPNTNTSSTGSSIVSSVPETQKTIDDYIKQLTSTTQTETGKQVNTLSSRVQELLGQTAGQQSMLQSELEKQGATQIINDLKNIQNEIATKTASFNQFYADLSNKPISMSSFIGQQAQARAVAQADIGFLQAKASALQNNLTFAQQQAQQAVDAKYRPILEELNIKQAQLTALQPQLDKEQKIYAQALHAMYYDQQTAATAQKQNEKNLTSFNLDSMAKYPSAGININDSYATTQQKIQNSSEYKLKRTNDRGGGGGNNLSTNLSSYFKGQTVMDGIKKAKTAGKSRAEVLTYLDANTKLTQGSINSGLDEIYGAPESNIEKDISNMSEEEFNQYITPAKTASGTFDINKIPVASRPAVLARMKAEGWFDSSDTATQNWLEKVWDKIKFWD